MVYNPSKTSLLLNSKNLKLNYNWQDSSSVPILGFPLYTGILGNLNWKKKIIYA